jgi:hypothetical protein
MKKMVVMLSLTAGMAGLSPSVHADLNSFLKSVDNQALGDIRNFNDRLSRQFGVPVPDVDAIVKSVPSPADAFMILQLGQMAHVPPAVVLQKYQRSHGKGWGNLAQELGIKPGSPEFHALKRGNLSFGGESGVGVVRPGNGAGQGHVQEHGHGMGKSRGR